jgi:hypothetical protein
MIKLKKFTGSINVNDYRSTDIVERVLVCPYCLSVVNDSMLGHCQESMAHFEQGYILNDGTIVLASEYKGLTYA